MDKNSYSQKESKSFGQSFLIALIVLVGLFVLYNDLIDIPRRNREYLESCYYINFTIYNSGAQYDYKRELFGSCINNVGSDLSKVYICWKENSVETINYAYKVQDCNEGIYNSSRILFK